jgi:hypothetical protein
LFTAHPINGAPNDGAMLIVLKDFDVNIVISCDRFD